jgi:hypothetical protein
MSRSSRLPAQPFRETYSVLMKWSASLRLIGTIIAVVLAITMAIFPISMPRAAVPSGHHHGAMHSGHGHHDHAAMPTCDHRTVAHDETGDQSSHDAGGQVCCSMGACHAFQVGTVPALHVPSPEAISVAANGDEQVNDVISSRLDRPPKSF